MPIKYQHSKHALINNEESLTEQEHLESCDINIMIYNAHRGMEIPGGGPTEGGYDDTTLSGLDLRIQLDQDLNKMAEEGITKEEYNNLHPTIRRTKKFKLKKTQEELDYEDYKSKKSSQNNDKTTKQEDTKTDPPPKVPST